jgi:hypothetical protein
MKKTINRIAPWQAAKVFAAIYFVMGLAAAVLLGLMSLIVPPPPGEPAPGLGFFLMMPILYGLAGLIFVPIGCWLFNVVTRRVGGIEVNVESSDAI